MEKKWNWLKGLTNSIKYKSWIFQLISAIFLDSSKISWIILKSRKRIKNVLELLSFIV